MVGPVANPQIPAATTFKPGVAPSEQNTTPPKTIVPEADNNAVKELNARNEERRDTVSFSRNYDSGASASGSDSRGGNLDISI